MTNPCDGTATGAQRWTEQRASYRKRGEAWAAYVRGCEVAPIENETARAFVTAHHYSASYPAARVRHGLFHGGALVGVAVYSVPVRDCVLTSVFPGDARESVELGRFVLNEEVPFGGESWTLARSRELLAADGYRGIVSFSDPLPRTTMAGVVVMPGHVGTIYQASNAIYLGQAKAAPLLLLPDGRVFARRRHRAVPHEHLGRVAPAALPVAHLRRRARRLARGAADVEELRPWLAEWLPLLARKVRHPGNHKFAFPLTPHDKERLGPAQPKLYPKRGAAA